MRKGVDSCLLRREVLLCSPDESESKDPDQFGSILSPEYLVHHAMRGTVYRMAFVEGMTG